MTLDAESVVALIVAALGAGAAVSKVLGMQAAAPQPRPSTRVPAPPPAVCAPSVVEQVDELHGLLARRDHVGASVVLSHLAELPEIRALLERIARNMERASPAE
ncbi:MAG: hypothetical protein FJ027_19045 [Candidatus Rokubacteria bacterium]|nr:hypothetical protein [Candidatus Rokubacteria bacterium]